MLGSMFQSLGQMNPKLNTMMEGALENKKHWADLNTTLNSNRVEPEQEA